MDGSVGAASTDQIKSPVAVVALVGVAICSVFVIVFVAIFTVLQVSTWSHWTTRNFSCPLMCQFNDGSTSHLSEGL